MAEFKHIAEDTDLSILQPVDWDVVLYGDEYQVYKAPGFVHTVGGRWGENDYWACPRSQAPSVKNLIQFDSDTPVRYGIVIEETHYSKTKWGERRLKSGVSCKITRNDKPFYAISASDIAYAYAEAYRLIRTKILEGTINFNAYRYWEKEIEGRHILYKGLPHTLYQYMPGQCCAMAFPGHTTLGAIYNDPKYGCCGEQKLNLLIDDHIDWYPDSKDDELS